MEGIEGTEAMMEGKEGGRMIGKKGFKERSQGSTKGTQAR